MSRSSAARAEIRTIN